MNFKNRTIFTGDNLPVLRGINSGSIDLVYIDPPFNSKREWNAPIGSKAAGAGFKDTWTLSDVDLEWHDQLAVLNPALYDVIRAARGVGGDSLMSYLLSKSVRLMELHRVLKPTGSIYLHCDQTAVHSLKMTMDAIFGAENFRNDIIWHYQSGTASANRFGRKHDNILYYQVGPGATHNRIGKPVANPARYDQVDEHGRKFMWGGNWSKTLKRGTIKYYLDEGATCDDVWTWVQESQFQQLNSQSKERVGFPTQKPRVLLERIIQASSNEGDVVFDGYIGCSTTAVAAENLGRQWGGADFSKKAFELVDLRMVDELGLPAGLPIHRTDIPKRTDLGDLPPYKTHKTALYVEQEGTCNLCLIWFDAGNLSVDHIVPRKKGGTDHKDNLQLLCRSCNSKKGDRTWESVKADYFKGRRQR